MKYILFLLFLILNNPVIALNKVSAPGMTGYFVYQDGIGNKIVKHPTIPSVAYNLKGNKVDIPANNSYRKFATIKSDGSIVSLDNPSEGSLFSNLITGTAIILVLGCVVGIWNFRKKSADKKRKLAEMNALKNQLGLEAPNWFTKFYKNFRPSKASYLMGISTSGFFATIKDNVRDASDFVDVSIKTLRSEAQEVKCIDGITVGTVKFEACREELIDEKVTEIRTTELWTFNLFWGEWLLADKRDLVVPVVKEVAAKVNSSTAVNEEKVMEGGAKHKYSL